MDKPIAAHHGWVFTFNGYENVWMTATRENQHSLYNGGEGVLKSESIDTLITIIQKTNGEQNLIEDLLLNRK